MFFTKKRYPFHEEASPLHGKLSIVTISFTMHPIEWIGLGIVFVFCGLSLRERLRRGP